MLLAMMKSQTIEKFLNFSKSKLCNTATDTEKKKKYKSAKSTMVKWLDGSMP